MRVNCQKWSYNSRVKNAEAAQRRKIQRRQLGRLRFACDAVAAIRKIFDQGSGRKKKEEKKIPSQVLDNEFSRCLFEKSSKSFNLASHTVRMTTGPQGTVVTKYHFSLEALDIPTDYMGLRILILKPT
ncbi:hypothetical protein VNO77_05632 [Canavalia gladiata]|uniref:Uncharacterized protein n=1 Tax=Canavalia gladiata TaxID=3824 RepID=A0AAN9N5A7_CANGL